jgi:dipeptidyl aminopeptidase/acylaminoacyl peptidase
MMRRDLLLLLLVPLLFVAAPGAAQEEALESFSSMDVFGLEWVEDPQISPDGRRVVYVRRGMDRMHDRRRGDLWIVNVDGTGHRKLTGREVGESSPRWSPDGTRIAFLGSSEAHGRQIYVHWVDTGASARVTQMERSPGGIAWSPDGSRIAFSMHVPQSAPRLVDPPRAPDGAQWAPAPRVETRVNHEQDGVGILEYGFRHLFVVSAEGGDARQVTSGDFHHGGTPEWTPDGRSLLFSANRSPDWELDFRNSEIYAVSVEDGEVRQLTDQDGPLHSPQVAPDGGTVALLGYEDRVRTFQNTHVYLMNPDGSDFRQVELGMDRSVNQIVWDENGRGLYVQYDEHGVSKLGHLSLDGTVREVTEGLGGTSIGRPYAGSAQFSVADRGVIAMNRSTAYRPGELAITSGGGASPRQITDLNGPLLDRRALGQVEELWYTSTKDGRDLHGWIVTPPDHEASRPYPLIVEIHGGPISHYGPHFSPEIQLMASAGYVVFYPNARGSTSYGEEFADLLYHDFSGGEYQDIIDGVELLIAEGVAAADSLYVTGGSAGGTSTAWIVGTTDRFQAAVVQKPVMNWISKTLAADNHYGYAHSRYPGQPWENPMDYWDVSPISLVGSVTTPTMVILGELDLRTPTWEAKQLYHALKLQGVETMYVEVPGAYHFISERPSQLVTKVDHIMAWFERYR